jgi:hypothetical protein
MNIQNAIFTTFNFTFIFLLINLVVSFLFSFIYPKFRGFFLIEVIISIVASVVYYFIIKTANSSKSFANIDWKKINTLRYIDWSITTPLMLVSLSLFLSYNNKVKNLGSFIGKLVFFDLVMILSGYLGAINVLTNSWSLIIGFLSYFIIFYLIYEKFFLNMNLTGSSIFKLIIYLVYVVLWFIYGLIYNFSTYNKNLITNILDCIAKAFVGLSLALYLLFNH